jgi:chromosome segregation ATPase
MANEIKDEADVLAENITLTGQVKTLTTERDQARQQVTALTTERDAATAQATNLTTERDEARTQVTALTGERDQARQQVTDLTGERDTLKAANTKLTADMADFNKRVAAELVKRGIRPEGTSQAAQAPSEVKPRTFKERLAEARN